MAKLLLIAINGGYDATSGIHIGPQMPVLEGDKLDFDTVMERYDIYIQWLSQLYVKTMNVIHYLSKHFYRQKLHHKPKTGQRITSALFFYSIL